MRALSFYKGKKVLVTGHTGFKGTWLCKILVNAGADVTGYSLKAPTNPNLFELSGIENEMNSIIGDIRDLEHLKQVFAEVQPRDRSPSGSTADRTGFIQRSGLHL